MAALLLLTGPHAGRRHEVEGVVTLGRSPSSTIPLDDAKVSRKHAQLLVEEGRARVMDLGSRNGTLVNGERFDGEALLLPGDRLQIGDSTILFEPPSRASLSDRGLQGELLSQPVAEVFPTVGVAGALYQAGVALLSATSEAMILRRASEELSRGLNAEKAGALLGGMEGLMTAAVTGAPSIEVPRALVQSALGRREVSRAHGMLSAPIFASGGAPFGLLYAERSEAFSGEEQHTIAAFGRLVGEALTSFRNRSDGERLGVALVGHSRAFRKSVDVARRASSGLLTVVISGEPGTGRAQLAKSIHVRSPRGLGPLTVVDCRRAAAEIEQTLWGRLSAPGQPPKTSALLMADGGTLLLLSIESFPRHLSDRLVAFLSQRLAPVPQGGEELVTVRVMATALEPLERLAKMGTFDPDLARALVGVEVETAPLRDRKGDVALLFEWFWSEDHRLFRRDPPRLTPDAMRLLSDYAWPGNVEELRLLAKRLSLLYSGAAVSAQQLPREMQEGSDIDARATMADRVARLERELISEALRQAKGKKIRAAAALGISRPTLDKKIAEYHLHIEKGRS